MTVYTIYEEKMYGDGKLYRFLSDTSTSLPLAKRLAEINYLRTGRNTWIEDADGKFYGGYFL